MNFHDLLKKDGRSPVRLEDISWEETSGVDEPANEEPGWVIMKAADESLTGEEQEIYKHYQLAAALNFFDIGSLSEDLQKSARHLQTYLSAQGFSEAELTEMHKAGVTGWLGGKVLGIVRDVLIGKKGVKLGKPKKDKKPYPGKKTVKPVRSGKGQKSPFSNRTTKMHKVPVPLTKAAKADLYSILEDYGLETMPETTKVLKGVESPRDVSTLMKELKYEGAARADFNLAGDIFNSRFMKVAVPVQKAFEGFSEEAKAALAHLGADRDVEQHFAVNKQALDTKYYDELVNDIEKISSDTTENIRIFQQALGEMREAFEMDAAEKPYRFSEESTALFEFLKFDDDELYALHALEGADLPNQEAYDALVKALEDRVAEQEAIVTKMTAAQTEVAKAQKQFEKATEAVRKRQARRSVRRRREREEAG